MEPPRQAQGRLAPVLHDDPLGPLQLHDVQDVFQGDGLEVELVRGVVVRGDRLRVAVEKERLVPQLPQGEGRLHAAVVKLNPLADAVGPASQN